MAPQGSSEESHFIKIVGAERDRALTLADGLLSHATLGYTKGKFDKKEVLGGPAYYPQDFYVNPLDCHGNISNPLTFETHLDPSEYVDCVTFAPALLMTDPLYGMNDRTARSSASAHVPTHTTYLWVENVGDRAVRTLPSEQDEVGPSVHVDMLNGQLPESPLCVGGSMEYRYWHVDELDHHDKGFDHTTVSMEEAIHTCPPADDGHPRVYTTYVLQGSQELNVREVRSKKKGDYSRTMVDDGVQDLLVHPLVSETFSGGVGYDRLYRMRESDAPLKDHSEGYGNNRDFVYDPRPTTETDVNSPQAQDAMGEAFETVWERLHDIGVAVQRAQTRE